MWRILKAACFVVCPVLAVAYALELVTLLNQLPDNPRLQVLSVGFGAGVLAWGVLADKLSLWAVAEHELTHTLAALLFLQRVRAFAATDTGGITVTDGGKDIFVIGLAPYFLPTLALLWLPSLFLFRDRFQFVAIFVLGLLLGYHALSNVREFHSGQSDIQRAGQAFSFLFCVAFSLICFGFVLAVGSYGSLDAGIHFLAHGSQVALAALMRLPRAMEECFGLAR